MPGTLEIEGGVLKKYRGREAHVAIPEGVTRIGARPNSPAALLAVAKALII